MISVVTFVDRNRTRADAHVWKPSGSRRGLVGQGTGQWVHGRDRAARDGTVMARNLPSEQEGPMILQLRPDRDPAAYTPHPSDPGLATS